MLFNISKQRVDAYSEQNECTSLLFSFLIHNLPDGDENCSKSIILSEILTLFYQIIDSSYNL